MQRCGDARTPLTLAVATHGASNVTIFKVGEDDALFSRDGWGGSAAALDALNAL